MEKELLRQILDQLRFQSKQIEKLNLVMANMRKPCSQDVARIKEIKTMLDKMGPAFKNNPMAPLLDSLMGMIEKGEKDGD